MTPPDPFRGLESSPDATALDAAMRANPEDSLPRLVAADFWEEAGDAAFAAVLRIPYGQRLVAWSVAIESSTVREVWRVVVALWHAGLGVSGSVQDIASELPGMIGYLHRIGMPRERIAKVTENIPQGVMHYEPPRADRSPTARGKGPVPRREFPIAR